MYERSEASGSVTLKKVLVTGYFGFGNVGDEAILGGILADLSNLHSELKFTVVSGNPDRTRELHGTNSVLWTDIPAIVEAGRQSDLFLLSGGLFQDYWGFEPEAMLTPRHGGISFYGAFPLLASLLGKPCMLYAVGVGPLRSELSRHHTRIAFEQCQYATVRDPESLALLREIGIQSRLVETRIKVTADPGFSMSSASQKDIDSILKSYGISLDIPLHAVSLRYWDLDVQPDWDQEIAKALDAFLEEVPGHVIFLPFQRETFSRYDDDLAVIRRVWELLEHQARAFVFEQPLKPALMAGILSHCDSVLAMRFHGVLFALNAGVPVVNLSYDPKTSALMKRAGLQHLSLLPEDWRAHVIVKCLHRARQEVIDERMSDFRNEMRNLARENARVAVQLLETDGVSQYSNSERFLRDFTLKKSLRVVELEEKTAQQDREIAALQATVDKQQQILETSQAELAERDRTIATLQEQHEAITTSAAFRLIWVLWELRSAIAPCGSRRDHILQTGAGGTRALWTKAMRLVENLQKHRVYRAPDRPRPSVRGLFFILSGVPIDDTGGGARSAQIALELLHQGFAVVFINKFPRYESADLGLVIDHRNLFTYSLTSFEWDTFCVDNDWLLNVDSLVALVEFPVKDFIPLISQIRERSGVIVYDLLDDWTTSLGGDWYSSQTERDILDLSDVLVATTPTLVDRLRDLSQRPVTILPNAVNARLFDPDRDYARPADLPDSAWTIIYIGALWGEWFDWDLLIQTAKHYSEAAVVVIGDYRGQCPERLSNLHFLGLKPQTELPAYLSHSNVAIIPWKVNTITRATDPLKVYEYVAMRRPVIAPDLDPLTEIPGILRARDPADFVEKVAVARDLILPEDEITSFLEKNNWTARVNKLLEIATR